MRLLHVGSGFRPWRRGGLVAYIEDLIAEQVRRGDDVAYFFAGRHYPFAAGPRLKRWQRDGVAMLEVVDSPLHDHGRQPQLEVAEPRLERILAQVLDDTRPDVVHLQELAGLPLSVIEVVRRAGVPSVMTLQDYYALCPMFKLFDADGRVCLRRDVGADCLRTSAADPRTAGHLIAATMEYELARLPLTRRLDPLLRLRVARRLGRFEAARRARREPEAGAAAAFQRRRDAGVAALGRADCVIAQSHRVAEIHAELGVDPARMRTVQLTLAHIERLRPREPRRGAPLTFATLAGFESHAKGGALLLDAMRRLSQPASAGRFRLLVLGAVDPSFAARAQGVAGIEVRGPYRAAELDALLDEVDVGIVPSIWEEAYGYAGVELLAKGIPVIGNAIGGIVDYVRDGETGWLNRSRSGAELARIIGGLVERPERVAELAAKVRAARAAIVKPLARHADEIEAIYVGLIAGR